MMEIRAQTLICGANGTGFSTLLSVTTKSKYCVDDTTLLRIVINVGEGFTRYCADHGVKLTKIECIVLTSLAPHSTAGLPGLLLSLSTAGVAAITIIGPKGVAGLYNTMTLFVNRRYPEVVVVEISDAKDAPLPVQIGLLTIDVSPITDAQVSSVVYSIIASFRISSETQPFAIFLPYCKSFPMKPSMESIISTLNSSCIAWAYPLTCTDAHNYTSSVEEFRQLCHSHCIHGIIHEMNLRSNVVEFRQTQINIADNSHLCPRLFPQTFPCVTHEMASSDAQDEDKLKYITSELSNSVIVAENDMVVTLYPNVKVDKIINNIGHVADRCRQFTPAEEPIIPCPEATNGKSNYDAAEDLRAKLKGKKRPLSTPLNSPAAVSIVSIDVPPPLPSDIRVTFLGTGSASPSKHRSSSAILLQGQVNGGIPQSILLDAGECCISQLFQSCSGDVNRSLKTLSSLQLIWLSHHHADHICGLPMILQMLHLCVLKGLRDKDSKVSLITSVDVWRYTEYVACICGLDYLVQFIDISLTVRGFSLTNEMVGLLSQCSLLVSVNSVHVEHCKQSYAVVLSLQGLKVAYSGDCRPSNSFTVAGLDCDLLIHEATFDDDRAEDALSKRHSTIREALDVSLKMRAKSTVLTHFSQRYPTTPVGDESSAKYVAAVDLLSIYYPSQSDAASLFTEMLMKRARENLVDGQ